MAQIKIDFKDGGKETYGTPAALVDALGALEAERLAADKAAARLKARENMLKDWLINNLPKSDATGIAGKHTAARITTDVIPTAEDWDALYKHIKKTGEFELMQKRLGAEAVRERWDAGKTVPGVGKFNKPKVLLTAVKK